MQDGGPVRTHQERGLFHRVMADRDDQVGAVDGVMDIVALGQRGGAHIEPGAARDRALAHLGVEERDLQPSDERRQGVRQARATGGRAQHDERPPGLADELGRAIERGGRGDGIVDRVRRNERDVLPLLVGDILGQLQMHRPRPFLLRQPERLAHEGGDAGRAHDLARHLGQGRHGRNDVDDLEPRLLAAEDALLARDHDHRHRAQQGVGGAGRQIERARTQRREANPGLAGQPAMGRGHEGRRLFMACHHQPDRRTAQRFDDIEIFLSRNAEYLLYAFVLQCRDEQSSPVHGYAPFIEILMASLGLSAG